MPKQTPFYPRTAALNQPQVWHHWAGYLSAERYQYSVVAEYYATRDGVALFDTSPLFKYRISGSDATDFLCRVLTRDIRTCAVGEAQYTAWCNEAGFVLEDGVIMRLAADDYWLTTARPNLRYFSNLIADEVVEVVDISAEFAIVAVQGPKSRTVLQQLTDALDTLPYFGVTRAQIADADVVVSRTGFTGALGYEVWVPAASALAVWDALMQVGDDYNIVAMGETALSMARIEAGLLLIDIDFESAKYAWVDAQRETPDELGWGWMLRRLHDDDREFIGRKAITAERAQRTTRWKTVGLEIDYYDYERIFREIGIMPPKDGTLVEETHTVYNLAGEYAGYATSVLYSPLLKKHIAIAKLPLDLCKTGSEVRLELVPIKRPVSVLARVVKMPFYNPPHKTK